MARPRKPPTRRTRHVPAGVYRKVCPRCGREFNTDEPRTKYCSTFCEKSAANARMYARRKQQAQ